MKNLLITIIVFIGVTANVFPQEKSDKEKTGDKFFLCYSFDKAINYYTQSKNLSLDGQRRLAESYHHIDRNAESEAAYSQLIKSQGEFLTRDNSNINQNGPSSAAYSRTPVAPGELLPEDYYNYAMVLKSNGKYEESSKIMDIFCELKPEDLRALDYENNKFNLPDLLKYDSKYKIEHLNVNTEALDFGTSYYKSKIVFSSTRVVNNKKARLFRWTKKPFWDMYVSDVDSGQLKTPEIFEKSLNGNMHNGPASFSNDGTVMAFTRNNYNEKIKDRVIELQICFSNYVDGKWSKPVPFVYNNKDYSVGQPCLTSDGNTMYFTSDMPGGYGKADIYKTVKDENGEWGKPENLGNKINTEGDEMFPFLTENKKMLYFSSNGHFGVGGLDIHSCTIDSSGFGLITNAGSPLNTQYNDYAFIVNDSTNKGYFSSDRPGGSGGDDIYSLVISDPDVLFTVNSPSNIPVASHVRETFPIRNYVFFEPGSTEISGRYVLINKDQVKEFSEDRLEVFTPKNLSGRSARQMTVYYNVINILGERMGRFPSTIVRLEGASMEGKKGGLAMAESVKKYLVDVFGIDASRINTEGRIKPRIPSEQPGGTKELVLLREGDRRVSIWSESPEILMEYQTGSNTQLAPSALEAPVDSYISFKANGAKVVFSSWSMAIKDETGSVQSFGPYTEDDVTIPGKAILGSRPEGNFNVTMTGITRSGNIIKKEVPVHVVLWKPSKDEEMMRFSIIFEFNAPEAIKTYEKYLTDIVMPKIPINGKVIIHGHTDKIGNVEHNQKLSLARANDVKGIFDLALAKAGRTDVKFEVYGFGKDEVLAPFENKFPEERFYNRTVIIDIIPADKDSK